MYSQNRKALYKPVKLRYHIISVLVQSAKTVADGCTGRQLHPLLAHNLLIMSNYCMPVAKNPVISLYFFLCSGQCEKICVSVYSVCLCVAMCMLASVHVYNVGI